MKIFVFGNPTVECDMAVFKILPKLRKKFPEIEFKICDPNEEWYENEENVVIMDTVIGLEEPTLFESLDKFEEKRRVSLHDFDLIMDLKLLRKLGKIKTIKIIGIPSK